MRRFAWQMANQVYDPTSFKVWNGRPLNKFPNGKLIVLSSGGGSGDGLESHLTCSAARALSTFQIFIRGNRMVLLNVLQRAVSSLNNTIDPSSIEFNEALLQFYLLQLPGSIIRGSGMILTFLPLLENADPPHMI
ncbi:hypothetical protein Tco_0606675 [Tanacetum coccineum]